MQYKIKSLWIFIFLPNRSLTWRSKVSANRMQYKIKSLWIFIFIGVSDLGRGGLKAQ